MRNALGGFSVALGLLASASSLAAGVRAAQEVAQAAPEAPPAFTTVFIVRHAERASTPAADPPLSSAGLARAKQLAHVLRKTKLKAVYTTATTRTRQTVTPAASDAGLTPVVYSSVSALVSSILTSHRGHRVLVAGHSDTLQPIAVALGGSAGACVVSGDEYDNLCEVTIVTGGAAHGVNLQYGRPSP